MTQVCNQWLVLGPYLFMIEQNLFGQKVKGQGHRVVKCSAGMGMHVDMTA